MTQENLSFKDMCAHFDVTPRTLRYYEYIELLQPQRIGRARFYSPREVARMTLIMRGRRFGFSLEELRQWLQIYDREGSTAQMQAWLPIAQEKISPFETATRRPQRRNRRSFDNDRHNFSGAALVSAPLEQK